MIASFRSIAVPIPRLIAFGLILALGGCGPSTSVAPKNVTTTSSEPAQVKTSTSTGPKYPVLGRLPEFTLTDQ